MTNILDKLFKRRMVKYSENTRSRAAFSVINIALGLTPDLRDNKVVVMVWKSKTNIGTPYHTTLESGRLATGRLLSRRRHTILSQNKTEHVNWIIPGFSLRVPQYFWTNSMIVTWDNDDDIFSEGGCVQI